MGKPTKEDEQILQPVPRMEGGYRTYEDRVEATLVCRDCRAKVFLTLRGNAKKMHANVLDELVRRHAVAKHRCPAIHNSLESNIKRYFPDLIRGAEMVQEAEYREKKAGLR